MASARLLPTLRSSFNFVATLSHRNLVTGVVTPLEIEDGAVTDDATSRIRRTLSLTVLPSQSTWDVLDTPGGEITAGWRIIYPERVTDDVPLGVFVVDQDQIDYGPGGTIQITAPDRWVNVQRNPLRIGARTSIPGNRVWQEIKRLIEGAWPNGAYPFPGWSARLDMAQVDKVGPLLWTDGSREDAIVGEQGLATLSGLEPFFDAYGLAVLQPVPTLTSAMDEVWSVDAAAAGVLMGASRTRDRSTFRNAITAITNATDVHFSPWEEVYDAALDPQSIYGPLGYVGEDLQGPYRSLAQAQAAARARLSRALGNSQQVSLTLLPNPTLESGQVIRIVYPQTDAGMARPDELHVLDQVVTPLVHGNPQTMQTRSVTAQ